jgi:predicted esterase
VLVYLHGKCGDPDAFRAFIEGVPAHFTVVSVRGDIKCEDGTRTRWSGNVAVLDARIAKAVAAASIGRDPLRTDRWVVFGYSQGALRAEALVAKLPERYVVAILAAGPRAPREHALDRAGAVVLLAGAKDMRGHLMKAADELSRRGLPVRYQELPDAHHGQYGPRARETLASCFSWITERVSFTDEGASFQH